MFQICRERIAFVFDERNPDALEPLNAEQRLDKLEKCRAFCILVLVFIGASVCGYLWSLIPGVPSFTGAILEAHNVTANNSTTDYEVKLVFTTFIGSVFNGIVLASALAYLYVVCRALHELATCQCRQRDIVQDGQLEAGAAEEARCCWVPSFTGVAIMIPVITGVIVAVGVFILTIPPYLLALLGGAVTGDPLCGYPNATRVKCWETDGECLCALLTGVTLVLLVVCIGVVIILCGNLGIYLCRVNQAIKSEEEIPLMKVAYVERHGAL